MTSISLDFGCYLLAKKSKRHKKIDAIIPLSCSYLYENAALIKLTFDMSYYCFVAVEWTHSIVSSIEDEWNWSRDLNYTWYLLICDCKMGVCNNKSVE